MSCPNWLKKGLQVDQRGDGEVLSFNPEPTAKVERADASVSAGTVGTRIGALAPDTFAVGSGLNENNSEIRLVDHFDITSVRNMQPGACVMAKGGRASSNAAWGVTPQAQNTGNSPDSTGTASP